MAERIVIALGGNAILTDDPTAQAQMKALDATCDYIVPCVAPLSAPASRSSSRCSP